MFATEQDLRRIESTSMSSGELLIVVRSLVMRDVAQVSGCQTIFPMACAGTLSCVDIKNVSTVRAA
jgi:hypothetical protein